MLTIGLTGTLGAGKGTAVEYLKKKGFGHYSARAFIIKEIERRGLPVNRDTMTAVSNDLRKMHGTDYIARCLYEEALQYGRDAIIESIRATGELEYLRTKPPFYMIAIDADPRIRFARIHQRGTETDHISYEKFMADEKREMENRDPTKQSIHDVMRKADFHIENSTSEKDLYTQLDDIIDHVRHA